MQVYCIMTIDYCNQKGIRYYYNKEVDIIIMMIVYIRIYLMSIVNLKNVWYVGT